MQVWEEGKTKAISFNILKLYLWRPKVFVMYWNKYNADNACQEWVS